VDGVESEHRGLRALLPAAVELECCKSFNDALVRARNRHYQLVLLDSAAAVLNMVALVAQIRVLQPEAAVVGVAALGRNDDWESVTRSLAGFGFDDLVCRPFDPAQIALVAERYSTTWEDLVRITDDLIEVSRFRCRRTQKMRYLPELTSRIEAGLKLLSDACFDRAIVDLTRAENLDPVEIVELLAGLHRKAAVFGVTLRVAIAPAVAAGLHEIQESFEQDHFRWFSSAAEAREP
jgi:CheY-like chemotaxis protein